MAAHTRTLDELLDRLENAATIAVFPSARGAAIARRAYDLRQQQAGRKAWTPPAIFSWSQWVSSLWTALLLDGHDDRFVLNRAQERMLWREIIRSDEASDPMTPDSALAGMALSAMERLGQYNALSSLRRSVAQTTDTQAFARWAAEFLRRCDRGRWLSPSLLEGELARHVEEGKITLPPVVEIVSFDEPTPTRRLLLERIDAAGTQVDVTTLSAQTKSREKIEAANENAEMYAAAYWLRERMDEEPAAEFALVAPDLDAITDTLLPALREVLAPASLHVAATPGNLPWDSPAGERLGSLASVVALLDLLTWVRSALPMDRISGVLLCGMFAAGTLDERARFDVAVLQRETLLRPELDLRSVLRLARLREYKALTEWLQDLAAESDRIAAAPPRQSFAAWMAIFRSLANLSGWTRSEERDQATDAIRESVQNVFDLAATLDFAAQRVTFAEALDAVRGLCAEAPAWTNPRARLHVVSLAEAATLPVGGSMVLGATEASMVTAPRLHALLDWGLQRAARMPGTDKAADDRTAHRALERLVEGNRFLAFAASAEGADPSPRFAAIVSQLDCGLYAPPSTVDLAASQEPSMELLVDDAPLPPLPPGKVRGGARVLQLQAACGFQAFAEIRLGAHSMNSPSPGFDAAESGSVLHRVLDAFWAEAKTQRALRAMTIVEREDAIRAAVDAGVSYRIHPRDEWDRQYLDVQKERMQRVLRRWLELELDRQPFTVQARESKADVLVGPLELEVRLDRLDVLEDGGLVFIDYKTGASAKTAAWEGDRPDQPQLPLYSLLAEPEELRGLAFAKIRAGQSMQWTGYAAAEKIFPSKGMPIRDLASEASLWRSTLEALAESFAAGESYVSPKSYATNCKRCAQRLLCRLDVEALNTDDEEEESDDE